eukprot:4649272-Alexandrium_andersonii.AAC.1
MGTACSNRSAPSAEPRLACAITLIPSCIIRVVRLESCDSGLQPRSEEPMRKALPQEAPKGQRQR